MDRKNLSQQIGWPLDRQYTVADSPLPEMPTLQPEEALKTAFQNRSELLTLQLNIAAANVNLDAGTEDIDRLLSRLDPAQWRPAARREVLVNFLGFAFWDILTFSVTNWRDVGEFDEVRVDRISPADVRTLREFGTTDSLRGTGFAHFAAFLSRAYRENDYLLGRLHGVDRLIDIVCDAAGIDHASGSIDVAALKKRAFELILDAEEKYLPNSVDLIAKLRRSVSATA